MISSLAIWEDVLNIPFLNNEISGTAAQEANPPVNAGDLSSVDRSVGWRRRLSLRPACQGIAQLPVGRWGRWSWSVATPKKPQGQEGADGQNEEDEKTGLGCTLHPTTPQKEGSRRLLRFWF